MPAAAPETARFLTDVPPELWTAPADVLADTVVAIADQRVSPEGQEGMRAFLEKRRPRDS